MLNHSFLYGGFHRWSGRTQRKLWANVQKIQKIYKNNPCFLADFCGKINQK